MTPTLPLPLAASGFSAAIAEKSRVNELVEIDGVGTEPPVLPELGLVPLLPQAATTSAALTATAVRPTLLVTEYKETTSLEGGTCQT